MPVDVKFLQDSGEIAFYQLPDHILDKARTLPDDPTRYFLINEAATMLPLSALLQTRARPLGIENAIDLMRHAYQGKHARREPISVEKRKKDLYLVRDGNSTVTIAKAAGWSMIPCILIESHKRP